MSPLKGWWAEMSVPAYTWIEYYRRRAGHTQADAARRAGIDRVSWNRFERGHQKPSKDTADRMAKELGCTVEEVLMVDGHPSPDYAIEMWLAGRRADEPEEPDA